MRFLLVVVLLSTYLYYPLEAGKEKVLTFSISKAVAFGVKRNLELFKKQLEVRYKKMGAKEAFRAFLPQLNFSFNRAVTVNKYAEDSRQYRYELSVDQLIFDGGKTRNARDLAFMDYKIAKKILETEERKLRLQILNAFVKVTGGYSGLKLYQQFVQASKKELKLADLEVKLGTTTILDRDEVLSKYDSALINLLNGERELYSAIFDFKKVLLIPNDKKINLVGDPMVGFRMLPLKYDDKKLFVIAKNNRLDFIKSFLQYRKLSFEYKKLKKSWIPDISLSGKFFLAGTTYKPNEKGYDLSLNFSFPFFGSPVSTSKTISENSGKTDSTSFSVSPFRDISYLRQLSQLKSNLHFARFEKDALPESIKREIKLAVDNLKLAKRKFKIRIKQLSVLERRLKILELKVKLGEAKRLDLAQSRISFYEAKIAQVKQVVDYINTCFQLEAAVGLMPGSLKLFKSDGFNYR